MQPVNEVLEDRSTGGGGAGALRQSSSATFSDSKESQWAISNSWRDVKWTQLAPTGTPPSPRCSHSTTRIGASLIVFGGGRHVANEGWQHSNEAFALDLGTLLWRQLCVSAPVSDASTPRLETRPMPRRGHSACAWDEKGTLVVYGGYGGAGNSKDEENEEVHRWLDDVWLLDVKHERWALLASPNSHAPRPRARRGHSALVMGSYLYIAGGWTDRPSLYIAHNDVWRCNLCTGAWERQADVPFVSLTMPCATSTDAFVFVGAKDATASSLHLCVLRPATGYLTRIPTPPPPHAAWHAPAFASAAVLHEHVYIFGGLSGDTNTHRLFALHLASGCISMLYDQQPVPGSLTNKFTSLNPSPTEGIVPTERNSASLTSVGSQLVLFGGGRHPSSYFNDLWLLTPSLLPLPAPTPSSSHRLLLFLEASFGDRAFADVTFTSTSTSGIQLQELPLSKLVLASRSSLFAAMFRSGMREAARHVHVPIHEDVLFDTFTTMAHFIYTNNLLLTPDNVLPLTICANLYDVADLRLACEAYIINQLLDADCFADFLLFAAEHQLHSLFDGMVQHEALHWPFMWPLPSSFPALLLHRISTIRLRAYTLPLPALPPPSLTISTGAIPKSI